MPLTLIALDSIDDVAPEAWNCLVPATASPALRWEWLHAMEASGSAHPSTGWTPQHLLAYRGATLVGAAPAYIKSHSMGEYVYDFAWADAAARAGLRYYPKLLVNPPLAPMSGPRFLSPEPNVAEALMGFARTRAQELGLSGVHALFLSTPEARALQQQGFLLRHTVQYHWRNDGYAGWDDFLARFGAKRRHQLKREARVAEGLALDDISGPALTPAHAALAYKFYASTCLRQGWGQVQLNAGFFERVFRLLPEACELVVARRGDEVIAGAFNLRTRTHLYGRYWGCFESVPFLHFQVCLYHGIQRALRQGVEVFEPGAGGEHKLARGFAPALIESAHLLFDARLRAAVAQHLVRESAEVQAFVADGAAHAGFRRAAPESTSSDATSGP